MPDIKDAVEIFDYFGKTNILLAFSGRFDHQLNTSILRNSQAKLNELGSTFGINKKVYNVLVESVENVTRYSADNSLHDLKSMLLLCKNPESYKIITCNPVLNTNVDKLKEKLDLVKSCNLDELKTTYRQQILSKRVSENTAGLGLIDIAIKTDNNINYYFKNYSQNIFLYYFQAEISI